MEVATLFSRFKNQYPGLGSRGRFLPTILPIWYVYPGVKLGGQAQEGNLQAETASEKKPATIRKIKYQPTSKFVDTNVRYEMNVIIHMKEV